MLYNSLIELDRAHLVHPVTCYRGHEEVGVRVLKSPRGRPSPMRPVSTGRRVCGSMVRERGLRAGEHRRGRRRQLRESPYATGYFGLRSGTGHPAGGRLAERAPPGNLNHVYFTLGGSDAVDTTVRFIRPLFYATGGYRPRRTVHLGGARLSRLIDDGIGAYGAVDFPPQFRRAAPLAAPISPRPIPTATLSAATRPAVIAHRSPT